MMHKRLLTNMELGVSLDISGSGIDVARPKMSVWKRLSVSIKVGLGEKGAQTSGQSRFAFQLSDP